MNNDSSRTTAVLLGVVAAAAGLAVAAYLWRAHGTAPAGDSARNVTEVLRDCYARLRDVQAGLDQLRDTA